MRNSTYLLLLPLGFILFFESCDCSCAPDAFGPPGTWYAVNYPLPADPRNSAVSFVVGDNAYISTGNNLTKNKSYSDIWSFNPLTGWKQMATAPALFLPRSNAAAFSIGINGYISCGKDITNNYLKDTWQYNTATNVWTRKADFGGSARIDPSGFAIGNYGYVLCGYDGTKSLNDSWIYDANVDNWTLSNTPFPGAKRMGAVTFVYNSKAYIVTGIDSGGNGLVHDFYVFDPANRLSPWSQLRNITNTSSNTYDDDYTNIIRDHAVALVVEDSAYIATGNFGGYNTSTWGYDISNDIWFRRTSFTPTPRTNATGFTVQGKGYITTGKNNINDLNDLFQWRPYSQ